MNTSDVVFAVSIITPLSVSSILYARHALHSTAARKTTVAIPASTMANASVSLLMLLMLMSTK